MSVYEIRGGAPLVGEIAVSGAKNGALPLLFAAILAEGACTFYHVPNIGDVRLALQILSEMGARVRWQAADTVTVDARYLAPDALPVSLTAGMRASSYLLGGCLGRFGYVGEPKTGGCDFGDRPLDCHYDVFRALGAEGDGALHAPRGGLRGGTYTYPRVSVGATINGILAAVRARGVTRLYNCATESHVGDLIRFLQALGADIRGGGTPALVISGQRHLGRASFTVAPDAIEAGTYLLAGAASGGDVTVRGIRSVELDPLTEVLARAGCRVAWEADAVRVVRGTDFRGVEVETAPAPGYPTDLHPPLAAALCFAAGESRVTELVWQERFRYARELERMGAHFERQGQTLCIHPQLLHGAMVEATDLRGGAALVLAALAVTDRTVVSHSERIERGYERFTEKLRSLGGDITALPMAPSPPSPPRKCAAEKREEKDGGDADTANGDG